MKPDRSQAMHDARRLDSQHKRALVGAAADAALTRGGSFSIAGIARQAGVGRKFIYDHPELRAEAERCALGTLHVVSGALAASARVTTASLRADLANAQAAHYHLEVEHAALRRRLALTNARNDELEQQLFETREHLAGRTEELDAARQINRELMARLNREQK